MKKHPKQDMQKFQGRKFKQLLNENMVFDYSSESFFSKKKAPQLRCF